MYESAPKCLNVDGVEDVMNANKKEQISKGGSMTKEEIAQEICDELFDREMNVSSVEVSDEPLTVKVNLEGNKYTMMYGKFASDILKGE